CLTIPVQGFVVVFQVCGNQAEAPESSCLKNRVLPLLCGEQRVVVPQTGCFIVMLDPSQRSFAKENVAQQVGMFGFGERLGFAKEFLRFGKIQITSISHSQRHFAPQVNISARQSGRQFGAKECQRFSYMTLPQENLSLEASEFPVPVGIQRSRVLQTAVDDVER